MSSKIVRVPELKLSALIGDSYQGGFVFGNIMTLNDIFPRVQCVVMLLCIERRNLYLTNF